MAESQLINKVKTALRITTAIFDEEEIEPLIEACLVDLKGAGVNITSENKALSEQAVIFYCKAYFGKNQDSEKWEKHYEKCRDALASRTVQGDI